MATTLSMSQMMEDLQDGCGGDAVVQAVITSSNTGFDSAKGGTKGAQERATHAPGPHSIAPVRVPSAACQVHGPGPPIGVPPSQRAVSKRCTWQCTAFKHRCMPLLAKRDMHASSPWLAHETAPRMHLCTCTKTCDTFADKQGLHDACTPALLYAVMQVLWTCAHGTRRCRQRA